MELYEVRKTLARRLGTTTEEVVDDVRGIYYTVGNKRFGNEVQAIDYMKESIPNILFEIQIIEKWKSKSHHINVSIHEVTETPKTYTTEGGRRIPKRELNHVCQYRYLLYTDSLEKGLRTLLEYTVSHVETYTDKLKTLTDQKSMLEANLSVYQK